MSDIERKLLEWESEGRWRGNKDLYETLYKARMEIKRLRSVDIIHQKTVERLRAALREIASHPWPFHPVTGVKFRVIAREALGEDE